MDPFDFGHVFKTDSYFTFSQSVLILTSKIFTTVIKANSISAVSPESWHKCSWGNYVSDIEVLSVLHGKVHTTDFLLNYWGQKFTNFKGMYFSHTFWKANGTLEHIACNSWKQTGDFWHIRYTQFSVSYAFKH